MKSMFKFLAREITPPAALIGTLGAATLALLLFTFPANATSLQQLQQLADEAALVGVNTLGTSEARADADKGQDAVTATKQMIGNVPGVQGQITASIANLTVTVKLSMIQPSAMSYIGQKPKMLEVASTARYAPANQPSQWAWASRQRFAVGRAAVIVGSTCSHDCGTERLR
jgi:hypothetical protein